MKIKITGGSFDKATWTLRAYGIDFARDDEENTISSDDEKAEEILRDNIWSGDLEEIP